MNAFMLHSFQANECPYDDNSANCIQKTFVNTFDNFFEKSLAKAVKNQEVSIDEAQVRLDKAHNDIRKIAHNCCGLNKDCVGVYCCYGSCLTCCASTCAIFCFGTIAVGTGLGGLITYLALM